MSRQVPGTTACDIVRGKRGSFKSRGTLPPSLPPSFYCGTSSSSSFCFAFSITFAANVQTDFRITDVTTTTATRSNKYRLSARFHPKSVQQSRHFRAVPDGSSVKFPFIMIPHAVNKSVVRINVRFHKIWFPDSGFTTPRPEFETNFQLWKTFNKQRSAIEQYLTAGSNFLNSGKLIWLTNRTIYTCLTCLTSWLRSCTL